MKKEWTKLINSEEVFVLEQARHADPHHILGPHDVNEGVLLNTYVPTAVSMRAIDKKSGAVHEMEDITGNGFYSVIVEDSQIFPYELEATYDNGDTQNYYDPYSFAPLLDEAEQKRFQAGVYFDAYEKLGAHQVEVDGIAGVYFAVYAPVAARVSVVGNFNLWDGRRHPMRKLDLSGIYELFVPGLTLGELYKFEIRATNGDVFLKADPYANAAQLRPDTASIVTDINGYTWNDKSWLGKRKKADSTKTPMSIYEVHLGAWKKPNDGREYYNYREIAILLAEYIKEMEYTHIEIMPIMEYPYDPSWGYQVTGYYAPTARYGTPEDFMFFMNYMHEQEIGVILDWVPAHFPKDACGLGRFDGTAVYEHEDPRQGEHPDWGTYIFNYGRNEVKNFLIGNAMFWLEKYHVDGIRMDAVASMLYLDYGRNDGQWIPNMYGSNENLEAVEFLKQLNSTVKDRKDGTLVIAEESTAWAYLTRPVDNDGVGFDYKWNMGWMNDFLDYMKADPIYRKFKHGELTFSMVYAYSEKYILVLSHDEVVHGKGSMINKMPGSPFEKFANLRVAYGFMMMHPGKKLLFMGQDMAQYNEFDEKKGLDWELLEQAPNRQMKDYYKALNHLYQTEPSMYAMDTKEKGFEWINNISADESILVFLRKSRKREDTLLVVCNFTPLKHTNYKVGVPYRGRYKEIFNSDAVEFGGSGFRNPRLKQSKKDECDARDHSIRVNVPPLGMSVFKYSAPLAKKDNQ